MSILEKIFLKFPIHLIINGKGKKGACGAGPRDKNLTIDSTINKTLDG